MIVWCICCFSVRLRVVSETRNVFLAVLALKSTEPTWIPSLPSSGSTSRRCCNGRTRLHRSSTYTTHPACSALTVDSAKFKPRDATTDNKTPVSLNCAEWERLRGGASGIVEDWILLEFVRLGNPSELHLQFLLPLFSPRSSVCTLRLIGFVFFPIYLYVVRLGCFRCYPVRGTRRSIAVGSIGARPRCGRGLFSRICFLEARAPLTFQSAPERGGLFVL